MTKMRVQSSQILSRHRKWRVNYMAIDVVNNYCIAITDKKKKISINVLAV